MFAVCVRVFGCAFVRGDRACVCVRVCGRPLVCLWDCLVVCACVGVMGELVCACVSVIGASVCACVSVLGGLVCACVGVMGGSV